MTIVSLTTAIVSLTTTIVSLTMANDSLTMAIVCHFLFVFVKKFPRVTKTN